MKRVIIAVIVLMLSLSFIGCNNSQNDSSYDSSEESLSSKENITYDVIRFGDVPTAKKVSSAGGDNKIEYYAPFEVSRIINQFPNLKAEEDILVNVPKSIEHLSTFYDCSTAPLSPYEGLKEFFSMFKYLFPGYELDEKSLYYYGNDGDGDPFNLLYENYNEIMNETFIIDNSAQLFIYDEKPKDISESSVQVTIRSPFGNDICMFNKGVIDREAARIYGESQYRARTLLFFGRTEEDLGDTGYFDYVGTYPPDSTVSFPLLDKNISINDAVSFFEDYINTLPCSITPDYSIRVDEVNVYKAEEGLYCYSFITSRSYDNIPFDYVASGSHGGRSGRDMGAGAMIKSNDVDWIYGCFRTFTTADETRYTDYISFGDAAKIVSEQMTDYVDFKVTHAQLVYCRNGNVGSGNQPGETKQPVFPAWRFLLFNQNDNVYYTCYVNALDGSFEYYK